MERRVVEIEGVSIELGVSDGRVAELRITVPRFDFELTAKPVMFGSSWSYKMVADGAECGSGTLARFSTVCDHIPKILRKRNGYDQQRVALIAYQFFDRDGVVGDRALGVTFEPVANGIDEIERRFGGETAVDCIRGLAEQHGYSLVPDPKLVAKLGECHAYHELVGGIWDGLVAGGAPSVDRVMASAKELGELHEFIARQGDKDA